MPPVTVVCPNCGAPVKFSWDNSVQSVCTYCTSIIVRQGVDVSKVGEVSSMPDDASPLQIGSEGVFKNKGFVAVGRILYQYENGAWNEWHIRFSDGTGGWLADAQLEYAVSAEFREPGVIPSSSDLKIGQPFRWVGTQYEVTSITRANYRGVEGELPFEYWDKTTCVFADLRSAEGKFATIDYSELKPLVFLGEAVDYDALKLKNLRQFEGWTQ